MSHSGITGNEPMALPAELCWKALADKGKACFRIAQQRLDMPFLTINSTH